MQCACVCISDMTLHSIMWYFVCYNATIIYWNSHVHCAEHYTCTCSRSNFHMYYLDSYHHYI